MTESNENRNPLILVRNKEMRVDSRDVAQHFKKQHREVLRAIDDLIKGLIENEAVQKCTTLYFNELRGFNVAANRDTRHFEMSRDGFSLLVMGFTGLEDFRYHMEEIWIPQHGPRYFGQRDPQALPYLTATVGRLS